MKTMFKNKKAQVKEITLNELIIGFGFFEGLWLAVGVNPEIEILKAFIDVLNELGASFGYILLLKIFPILFLIGTLLLIYNMGGKMGLVAVGCAFLGGVINFNISDTCNYFDNCRVGIGGHC